MQTCYQPCLYLDREVRRAKAVGQATVEQAVVTEVDHNAG